MTQEFKIKFRAWHKEHKYMYRVFSVIPVFEKVRCVLKECDLFSHNKFMYLFSFDEIELMPYINVNDINNTEIYVGDIVEIYTTDDNGYLISTNKLKVINFKNGCFRYGCKEFSLYNCCQNFFKVVGNVYENPELLENKEKN